MQDSERTSGSERTLGAPGDAPTLRATPATGGQTLSAGTLLAGRYEIKETLGVGGMGAVYKAFDRQLARFVALKTILPELAATSAALARFRQEVLVVQQITHKNVVRIFDISEDNGTKFITMDFIEGSDLKSLILQRGKSPAPDTVAIMRQVCQGLEAAHAAGVVHRDLKPQNIMVEKNGHALVMDFGIAHSGESRGVTQTGTFLGTPEYMSPEQALAEDVDARSDIFSLGLIFYEMLTGKVPFHAKTALETMFIRTKQRAIPPVEIDPSIPSAASDIVVRCLEIERERRYPNVSELLANLETVEPVRRIGQAAPATPTPKKILRYRKRFAVCAVLCLAVLAGFMFRNRFLPGRSSAVAPMTLLVADFTNTTGDGLFSNTLESLCVTALEGAAFINTYERGQARALLGRLENGATNLDEPAARKLALREGIGVIVTGSIARDGAGYQVSVKAMDAPAGKVIATKLVRAANARLVLENIGTLIAPIRTALGDTTPESAQLAAAQTYAAHSLEAAHAYALGKENQAKPDEAIRYYLDAIGRDPNFGQAYAGLAEVHARLRKQMQADEYYKKAVALLDAVTEREKYRVLGAYSLLSTLDYEQCIEDLHKLVFLYPADGPAYNDLSICYARSGNMTESAAASRRAVELSPFNLEHRSNYALHSMYAGDVTSAVSEAGRVLQQDATFRSAYLTMALSSLFRGDTDKAVATYGQLEKVSSQGASLAKMGLSDFNMYAGRYQDAVRILQTGISTDQTQGNSTELVQKLVTLAEAYSALSRQKEAAATAARALEVADADDGIRFFAARVLIEAGETAKAEQIAAELQRRTPKQTRSLALMIAGQMALKQNRIPEAVDAYREAVKLHDSWLSRLLLGEAYVQAGHFPEALAELEIGERRATEATDLFDGNTTTLRYLPPLYYWLGRAQEGLGTSQSAGNSYQRFIAIRARADSADPLLGDAKRRAAALQLQ